jgi:hypothetical protein
MIPNDPVILLSYINTQLRDNYKTLDDLCQSLGVQKNDLVTKLHSIDYHYNETINQFQ